MNWNQITEFNFTYAIDGGAWVKDADGNCNWEAFTTIAKHLGKPWIEQQRAKQGIFTGCWIKV